MMLRRTVMSATSRLKEGKSLLTDTVTARNTTNGNTKAQIRTFQSKSSPIYKTQSETSLVSGFRNLGIREKPKQSTNHKPPTTRRGFCTGNSGRLNIRSLQDVANIFKQNQIENVVVVAGAGISTPSGIPDFRTPGTGLYDNLQQYQIPYPEAIFDIDYFHRNPKPFFTLAKELFPSLGNYRPNYIHYFVRVLYEKGLLLRMYTQNIDGLERLAGIPASKLVEAHGTFATATCTLCGYKCDGDDIKDRILNDNIPKCKKTSCSGMVKPDIVFFGEDLPRKFYYHLRDMLQADMVLVMGTSLEVQPFAGIIDSVRWQVPRILFNRDVVGPFRHHRRTKDVVADGDILQTMQKFATMIGWSDEMVEIITQSEGSYNVGTVTIPTTTTTTDNKPTREKDVIKDPFVNAIWRQNTTFNLFNYTSSDSETGSESSTTESESSEDERPRPVRPLRQINSRLYNNTKNSAPTKPFLRRDSSQNLSTTSNKPSVRNNKSNPPHVNKDHVPIIKEKRNFSPAKDRLAATGSKPVRPASERFRIIQAKPPIPNSPKTSPPKRSDIVGSRLAPSNSPKLDIQKGSGSQKVKNNNTHVSSVHAFRTLCNRSGSADLPKLRLREKLGARKIVESSSSESVNGTSGSGS
ncbi:hypothetical protein SNE40_003433 [Patella caerulea]|uniref:Deacetylase sirtuin-type domain-containing protein n=1 Tax=Patella caerulea TaxID=87958 RepID=A0AAN8KGD9_PATCE